MTNNLLIIESPAKARTIKKYLGPDFKIMASVAHVKDLPVNKLGVDRDKNFEPHYVTIKGKGKILKELTSAGTDADVIYLAPTLIGKGKPLPGILPRNLPGKKIRRRFIAFYSMNSRQKPFVRRLHCQKPWTKTV